MGTKLVQRATILAVVLAAAAGGVAAYLVAQDRQQTRRADRLDAARALVSGAVHQRAFYLQDIADMVGVHDDADIAEFSRYAQVRRGDDVGHDSAVAAVQWVRGAPGGHLAPVGDVPPGTRVSAPTLVTSAPADRDLANAIDSPVATPAIRRASLRKRPALSGPVRLANGHQAVYLAVPVEGHRFSGEISKLESRSAIVGLIDVQALVAESFGRQAPRPLRVSDAGTVLASAGPPLEHVAGTTVDELGRPWRLAVDGGSVPVAGLILPWAILLTGLLLAGAVAVVLRQSNRRRDGAMRLVSARTAELQEAHAEAVRRSREDSVTETFNRRHFSEALGRELSRSRRGDSPPAVLLLDIDHFKSVNDSFGHLTGDAALRATAERLTSVLRGSDLLARWGGEEFAILAPGTDTDGAVALAERARAALAESPVEADEHSIQLTVSIGVAVSDGEADTAESLIGAADRALYAAKDAGRDCVRVAEDEAAPR